MALLATMTISVFAGGCAHVPDADGAATPKAACEVFKPITWARADTKPTVRQIQGHNAAGGALCGWTPPPPKAKPAGKPKPKAKPAPKVSALPAPDNVIVVTKKPPTQSDPPASVFPWPPPPPADTKRAKP